MHFADLMLVPELEKCRSLLCVQPHPDDNEICAGGTIARLAASGCAVTCLTVTDGSLGTMDPAEKPGAVAQKRRIEAEMAAHMLGASAALFLEYPDAGAIGIDALSLAITGIIRQVKPDMVMTVDPFLAYEAHPDHRRTGLAVAQACLLSPFPHYAPGRAPGDAWSVKGVAFYATSAPNTFVNVDDTWDIKIRSIRAHESQFDGPAAELLEKYLEFKAAQYAAGRGCRRAEAFKVLSCRHLHMNVDTACL